MRNFYKIFFMAMLCCFTATSFAYNPALQDESRWGCFDSDEEKILSYDKNSISFAGGRYIYVWVKNDFTKEGLQDKSQLELWCVDTKKKKTYHLDGIAFIGERTAFAFPRLNALSGENCEPTKKKYIEEKANKNFLANVFDKKEKQLLVETDATQYVIPDKHAEKWNYVADLSTNVWKYIGARNLYYYDTLNNDEYVFYYDKQSLKVSESGEYVSVWLKYRLVEESGSSEVPKKVKYGLTRTTINLKSATYTDHVALSFKEDGTLEKEYTEGLDVANPIYAGTIMEMILQALRQELAG